MGNVGVGTDGRLGRWGVEFHLHLDLDLHLGGGHRRGDDGSRGRVGGRGGEAPSTATTFNLLRQQTGISSDEDGMATIATRSSIRGTLATPHGGKEAVLEHVGHKGPPNGILQLHHLGPVGIQPPTAQPIQSLEIAYSDGAWHGGNVTQQIQTEQDGHERQFRGGVGGADGRWKAYRELGQVPRQFVQHVEDQGAMLQRGWVGTSIAVADGGGGTPTSTCIPTSTGPAKQGHHSQQMADQDHRSRRVDPPPQDVQQVPFHVRDVLGGKLTPGQFDEAGQTELGPVDLLGCIGRRGDGGGETVLDEVLVDRGTAMIGRGVEGCGPCGSGWVL